MLQMIRKALMYMILSFIFWFFTGSVFAGISLIQSFEEINITGDFYFNVSVSDAGDVNNDWIYNIIIRAHLSDKSYIYTIQNEFQDIETVSSPGIYYFNEGRDGHQVDMDFTNLTWSGNVTVDQINLPPSNAPCTDVCNFYWDIIKDADSTSFSVNVTFHCTNSDVSGFTESEAYLGIGKFNSTTNNWVWLGGTVNVLYRNQLLI